MSEWDQPSQESRTWKFINQYNDAEQRDQSIAIRNTSTSTK